jgi:TfoX/Sxy family transcriptional regulator of competence genes
MAYDQILADRVLERLLSQPGLEEKAMFGGVSFMVRGNLACGVVKDDLCVRVGKNAYVDALALPDARPMDFTGKPMASWVFISPGGTADDETLQNWVERGLSYALSLPPK